MRAPIFTVLLCLTAAGCMQPPMHEQALQSQSSECRAYGFKEGTDAFSSCMQSGMQDRQRRTQMAAATMFKPDPVYLPPMQPISAPAIAVRPQNCISNVVGNSVYTNCY